MTIVTDVEKVLYQETKFLTKTKFCVFFRLLSKSFKQRYYERAETRVYVGTLKNTTTNFLLRKGVGRK